MKHVQKIRAATVHYQQRALGHIRYQLAAWGENNEALEKLRGDQFELFVSRVTEFILGELGHVTSVTADDTDARSRARRAVARAR